MARLPGAVNPGAIGGPLPGALRLPKLGQGVPGGAAALPDLNEPGPFGIRGIRDPKMKQNLGHLENVMNMVAGLPSMLSAQVLGSELQKSIKRHQYTPGGGFGKAFMAERGKRNVPRRPTDPDAVVADFENRNLPPETLSAIREVVDAYNKAGIPRHHSSLSTILKGLNVIESVTSGYMRGTADYRDRHNLSWLDQIKAPWTIYHQFGAGFKEIPQSIHDGYTFSQYNKDFQDPNSIWYKHANVVGLTESIFFDPTTYLSFGATSTAKHIAMHNLAEVDKGVDNAVTKLLKEKSGEVVNTIHGPIEINWHNRGLLWSDYKTKHGLPFTIGDALDNLREEGLAMKAGYRSGEITPKGKTAVTRSMRRAGAFALPYNVPGGRGIRFAGLQIPGTGYAGEKIANKLRLGVRANEYARLTGKALIPGWAGDHVYGDSIRAGAAVEMGRYHQSVAAAVAEVDKSIKELQSVEIRSAEDRAAMNIMGGPTRVIVPPEQRVNLLTRGESTLSAAQRIMRTNITAEQEHWTAKAVESGVSEKSLGELWDTLVKAYPENPLMALGEFKAKASVRQLGRDFIHSMVNDGRFSIPLAKEGEKPMGLLTEVPVGYRKLDWAGKRYAVVEPIHEAISQITNPAVIDMGLKNFVTRVLGAPQQWWKIYATSPNPAFHVMNFLGATWNNVLAGVLNPADYLDAAATLYRGRREEAAQVGARFGLTRRVPESTPAGREAQQVLGEAESRAGLGRTGFLFGDISRGRYSPQEIGLTDIPVKHLEPQLYKQAVKDLERGRKLGKKVLTPPPGATKKQAARFYGVTTPRRAAGVVLVAHLNPLSLEIGRAHV